jgi:hypothetical protein
MMINLLLTKKLINKKKNIKNVFIGEDPNEKSLGKHSPFKVYYKKLIKNHARNIIVQSCLILF